MTMQFRREIVRRVCGGRLTVACLLVILSPVTFAATPLREYRQRVSDAAKIASDLAINDYGRDRELGALERLSALLPATEDIAREGDSKDLIHVDNSWLQGAITKLDVTDEGRRSLQLTELSDRLRALEQSLADPPAPRQSSSGSEAQMRQILARPEYLPVEKKDSAIQAWIKKVRDKISELIANLLRNQKPDTGPAQRTFSGFQLVVVVALAVVLIWAMISLFNQFQRGDWRRKEKAGSTEPREVLGEQFDENVTADDLIRSAAGYAQQGDFRLAIRRAYLAALYALEQRGKLHLHRAKTNNDYLRELRAEGAVLPAVATMTSSYERVWYGNERATIEDYSGFIDRYHEVKG